MYHVAQTKIIGTVSNFKRYVKQLEILGGAMIILAGYFRQTLPVITRSTATEEINACLKTTNLWRYEKPWVYNEYTSGVAKWHIGRSFLKGLDIDSKKIPVGLSSELDMLLKQ